MNRITELFQRKDRNLLSVYFTAGYPVLEDTVEIIQMLENRGVDLVEIGIPFSDPMADGVVIQQSSTQALKNGMTLPVLLEQLTSIRSRVELPLLLMGYLNPMLRYGMENLFRKGMEIGIDGMIIPDLPFQEYLESVKPLCEKYDIPVIMLITPETSDERIRLIDEYCGGFIYMVSSASTTGVKDRFTAGQIEYFQRIDRLNLKNKRLIGFGISNGESLSTVCRYSSGAIIGSLFVKLLGTNISTFRRLTTQMYPYVASEKMLCSRTYISSVFHLGKLDLKAAASFAIGNFTEKNRTTATDTEPGDPPYRLTDYYNLKNEYTTAPQTTFHLGLRYHFNYGVYAEVQGSYTHGFNLQYIDGSNRWNETIKLGYTF